MNSPIPMGFMIFIDIFLATGLIFGLAGIWFTLNGISGALCRS